jgi:rubrerythrin
MFDVRAVQEGTLDGETDKKDPEKMEDLLFKHTGTPQEHLEKHNGNERTKSGVIYEVSKYITKDAEISKYSLSQLREWLEAVKGMRLWVAAGCLKINETDIENEMIHTCNEESTENICPVCGARLETTEWEWNAKQREYEQSLRPLTWPEHYRHRKHTHPRRTEPSREASEGNRQHRHR